MPNWIEGNIRVRGSYKSIIKLFKENLSVVVTDPKGWETHEYPPEVDEDKHRTIIFNPRGASLLTGLYVKGTRRNFIDGPVEIWDENEDDTEIIFCQDKFKAAWSFTNEKSDEAYRAMAQKYGVDIRLYGIEAGMEFTQWKTYYRDGRIEERVEEYLNIDWQWECPFPNMGG